MNDRRCMRETPFVDLSIRTTPRLAPRACFDLGLHLQFIRNELDHFGYGKAALVQASR